MNIYIYMYINIYIYIYIYIILVFICVYIYINVYIRFYMLTYMYKHSLGKSTRPRSYSCFSPVHLGACPRTFTGPRAITCALLSKTWLGSAEKIARPARPELFRDQFYDFVRPIAQPTKKATIAIAMATSILMMLNWNLKSNIQN